MAPMKSHRSTVPDAFERCACALRERTGKVTLMKPTRTFVLSAVLIFTVQSVLAQIASANTSGNAIAQSPRHLTMSVSVSADGGRDRFGILTLQRGKWMLQNVNWTNPDGQSALSLLLVGRQFKVSRWADLAVLAGPWFSYEDHAWNEMVVDTNFTFHKGRFKLVSTNRWGSPLRSSGHLLDSHMQTMTGLTGLPSWLGLNFLERHSNSVGLQRLFVGPILTKTKGAIAVNAYPYWDFTRQTLDMRIGMSYVLFGSKKEYR